MKKRLFYFCIAMGIGLTGCGSADQMSGEVVQTNDSLTICALDTDQYLSLEEPLAEYRKRYPDVEIKIKTVAFDDLANQKKEVASELMAGEGADFYMNPGNILEDVYKAQEAGAFENLMPWFQEMEGFSEENYMSGTFDLYEHTDACYIFPSTVSATTLAIRKDMQENLGIDVNSWSNASDLLDTIEKFYETYPEEQPFLDMEAYTNFLYGYGYDTSDGMKNAEILDMPVFRKDMELYKKQAYRDGKYVVEQDALDYESEKEKLYRGETIHLGKWIYSDIGEYILMGGEEIADLAYFFGADGTMFVSASEDYAISSNSANKENAFHLLEIILEQQAENPQMLFPSSNKEVSKEYLRQQK
ncbi:MAG TPA: carbohydrate ABC transporter substrate-binding protein, partial [Candidatus Pullilachnospira stercoravium]|nr:carbohydrate ABC transporter substrate-binding protein [Candidatus Pullilachnospira stercoravium]